MDEDPNMLHSQRGLITKICDSKSFRIVKNDASRFVRSGFVSLSSHISLECSRTNHPSLHALLRNTAGINEACSCTMQCSAVKSHTRPIRIIRFGIIASKKIGNAVKRNKAKRRLKEAIRAFGKSNAYIMAYPHSSEVAKAFISERQNRSHDGVIRINHTNENNASSHTPLIKLTAQCGTTVNTQDQDQCKANHFLHSICAQQYNVIITACILIARQNIHHISLEQLHTDITKIRDLNSLRCTYHASPHI